MRIKMSVRLCFSIRSGPNPVLLSQPLASAASLALCSSIHHPLTQGRNKAIPMRLDVVEFTGERTDHAQVDPSWQGCSLRVNLL